MLGADQTGPWALARRLIKMPVYNDVPRFIHYDYVAPPSRAAIAHQRLSSRANSSSLPDSAQLIKQKREFER
jgi:hypothetical protein